MKAGIIGLTRGLAKRYAREGIRVNAISPGPVDTPMIREFVDRKDQPETKGLDREELVKKFGATTAMGRNGRPEEIAYAALFLLSDEASYITGAVLPVMGPSGLILSAGKASYTVTSFPESGLTRVLARALLHATINEIKFHKMKLVGGTLSGTRPASTATQVAPERGCERPARNR